MQTVFAGPFHVHYGQYSLFDGDHDAGPEWESLEAGGVGVIGIEAGSALLLTKRHTGDVALTVAYAEAEPALDESYDDVVEIDFVAEAQSLRLTTWHEEEFELPDLPAGPGNYRLRYHGRQTGDLAPEPAGMDEIVDEYLLQIWPAMPSPSRVVRSTSGWLDRWLTVS
ncbi:hypothetical protein [Catellatospora paridis]|uniref:hypothetical protein n=1 Tax=Catellatospora paridis TaxID=1617086 RepID=UPI0012D3A5A8|nr:hypothetical protein [Catellatospora paridis]